MVRIVPNFLILLTQHQALQAGRVVSSHSERSLLSSVRPGANTRVSARYRDAATESVEDRQSYSTM